MPSSVSQQYSQSMQSLGRGHALYQPCDTSILKVGSLGFFDSTSRWNPIANLLVPDELTSWGLKAPMPLREMPEVRSPGWGPVRTKDVNERALKVQPGIGLPNNGIDLVVNLEYSSQAVFGAVLLTSAPIKQKGFYFEEPIRAWVRENAKALLKSSIAPDIRRHGLIVVNQIICTQRAAIAVCGTSRTAIIVGFTSTSLGKDSLTGCSWSTSDSASNVTIYEHTAPSDISSALDAGTTNLQISDIPGIDQAGHNSSAEEEVLVIAEQSTADHSVGHSGAQKPDQVIFLSGLRFHKPSWSFAQTLKESASFSAGPFAHRGDESQPSVSLGESISVNVNGEDEDFVLDSIGSTLPGDQPQDDEDFM